MISYLFSNVSVFKIQMNIDSLTATYWTKLNCASAFSPVWLCSGLSFSFVMLLVKMIVCWSAHSFVSGFFGNAIKADVFRCSIMLAHLLH